MRGQTKPSQMLDKNPGLRDISPSITGGSVSAQGKRRPYICFEHGIDVRFRLLDAVPLRQSSLRHILL